MVTRYLLILKRFIFLFLTAFLPLVVCGQEQKPSSAQHPAFKFKTIIVDAGHGGKDPGAHGSHSLEKNIALAIAKKLNVALQDAFPSMNIIMTRKTDTFVELNRRSNIANENDGNLFISIHCNSTAKRVDDEKGVLLLVYGFHRREEQMEALRENASIYLEKDYQNKYAGYNDPSELILLNTVRQKYRKKSVQFADYVNHEFKNTDDRHSIGVKEQGVLVLAHSAMPAVLVETGFINNPSDERYLNSDEGQEEIVASIVRAVKKYKQDFDAQ
jgi:N-acetylmuramoyl-L-alanine amidase